MRPWSHYSGLFTVRKDIRTLHEGDIYEGVVIDTHRFSA